MKLFVYEYLCATHSDRPGASSSRAVSLMDEGRAMRDAAVADAAEFAEVRTLDFTPHEEREFRTLADWCDYALIIAPEFDDILATRVRWAEQCGATLLGPNSSAVELCADKLRLSEVWSSAGVPTPPTALFDTLAFPPPIVVKPRYGAGAGGTLILDHTTIRRYSPETESIVQPYVRGANLSMSFIVGPRQWLSLQPCLQDIRIVDHVIQYHGGQSWGVHPRVTHRILRLAGAAIGVVEGLAGYVGVDVIIGDHDVALEINPRLTTSYIGLRRWCQTNLMRMMIDVIEGRPVDAPTYHPQVVRFDTTGQTAMS